MKKKNIIYIIIFAVLVVGTIISYLYFYRDKYSYSAEYKMNLAHISDQDETAKYGKQVGNNCYLATTAMMLKHFDPSIEFRKVFVYQGNAISFNYYWPNGANGGTMASLANGSTDILLTAASNLGFTPHVRISRFFNDGMGAWWPKTKELGGDLKTYFLNPPMDEYKQIISSDIPLGTSGSPCHNDYNVIEGYSKKELFAIIPDPQDVNRTDPKISCPVGFGLTHTVFWFTPDGNKISDKDLMLKMKGTVNESLDIMARYIKNLKEGSDVIEFSQKIYLGREFASMYFQEQGYAELAAGYKKSTELLLPLASIYPLDINKHKNEIIIQMEKVLKNEKGLIKYWEAIN
ncbi:MAG: hypothetical protein COU51_01185 [Parcubacteria group bacterium CG10_big_fil_rev_8_21_14_0_10_36_14]|nr:MAG: hypothetical protein COU51_01185 [Parcubacteria group bacterium CG10_big_fil_rev_8_21_14_0_10_36_14]